MRLKYCGNGVLSVIAETLTDVLNLAQEAAAATADHYTLMPVSEADEDGHEAVTLDIVLRLRMPAEKKGKGEKSGAKDNGTTAKHDDASAAASTPADVTSTASDTPAV